MIQRLFAIDYRSLRLFRILFAAVVILDVLQRLPIVHAFYSDQGIWPRWVFSVQAHSPESISLFMFSGSPWWAYGLFLLTGLLAVFLLLGVRERAVSLLLLILLTSAQHRSPVLAYGYDVLLRTMAFWSILLPASRGMRPGRFADGVSVCALLQVAMVYFCAGFLKSSETWIWHPDAVYYALSLDFYVSSLGAALRGYPRFLQFLSVAVVLLERFGWLLFFIPWKTGWWRLAAVLALMVMHLGFAIFMDLGNFPWADISFLCLVLPSEFWDLWQRPKPTVNTFSAPGPMADQIWAGIFILLFVWWNLQDFSPTVVPMPRVVSWGYRSLGLDQNWGVFAPYPLTQSGWILADGRKSNGQRVDALLGRETPIRLDPGQDIAQALPNRHWVDFLVHLALSNDWGLRAHFADYLCSEWFRTKNENLRSVDLYYVQQFIHPPGQPREYFPQMIAAHRCPQVAN